MSLFQPTPCLGAFSPSAGYGTMQALTLTHATSYTRLVTGDLVVSFASNNVVSVLADVQPQPAGVTRELAGTIHQVAYTLYVYGNPDIRDGDRLTLSAQQLEVVTTARWHDHIEADLKFIGR